MISSPLRALRRLLAKTVPAAAATSLVTTGLVVPTVRPAAAPPVSDKVQTLSTEPVRQGWRKSVETGQPTQLVGFEWKGRTEGTVEVRTRNGDGWSDWAPVHGDPFEGPDPGSREHRDFTTAGPLWVGKDVRRVEVRVTEGELRDLKLHALRSEEPRPPRGVRRAGAAPANPGIVSRAGWGADESLRRFAAGCNGNPEYAPAVRFAVVHHTVNSNAYSAADSPRIMRAIYEFHTKTNKWCDIGYNFVVDRFGTVFEGRFGGTASAVIGAHALGFNNGSTGVALLGTFSNAPVPPSMYNSLRALLAWKLAIHNINPLGTVNTGGRTIPTVIGHRDVNATECPGQVPYNLLPQLRNELGERVREPSYAFVSARTNKRMDVAGVSMTPGAAVIQWPGHGGANQKWNLVLLGGDAYRIVAVHSGQVLDVAGDSTAPGAPVIQWPWHGGANQQWRLDPVPGTDRLRITSVRSGHVLDVEGDSTADGARIIQWPWHGGANQQWARPQV
ncbi:MAG TPA: RICIN domain-containing protein [Acidimicrobiales bacterium]|nr:RICIN domain-containing protein [Acidimicrobiales bacterium]